MIDDSIEDSREASHSYRGREYGWPWCCGLTHDCDERWRCQSAGRAVLYFVVADAQAAVHSQNGASS